MAALQIGDVVSLGVHRNHRDERVLVRIEGTARERGARRLVPSSTAVHSAG